MKKRTRKVRKGKWIVRERIEHFWKCEELGANKLGIECPHCEGKTVVNRSKWLNENRLFITRGCTYCDWFAMIPVELLSARDQRRKDYQDAQPVRRSVREQPGKEGRRGGHKQARG